MYLQKKPSHIKEPGGGKGDTLGPEQPAASQAYVPGWLLDNFIFISPMAETHLSPS